MKLTTALKLLNPWWIIANRNHLGRRFEDSKCAIHSSFAKRGLPLTRSDRSLKRLEGIYKGRRCFVLGNGPSLRVEDLDKLLGEVTFAANKIYLLFPKTKWRPSFYNVEDDLVAKQNIEAINTVHGPIKFFHDGFQKWLADDYETVWYRVDDFPLPFPQFSLDPLCRCSWGGSVTYINLQMAVFMGVQEIYLLGVDFSFLESSTKKDDFFMVHDGEVNHFSPDYRKPGEIWNPPLIDVQKEALEYCVKFCSDRGINIYNATRGGKLEAFPRVDFDSLF